MEWWEIFLKQNLRYRIVSTALLLALLCWMYFDTTGYRARKSGITAALSRGDIGSLNSEDSRELKATIDWLAQAAGVSAPIELNKPPSEDRLTVYTTTPAAERLTGCSKGNVVFDSEMNAIFVDIGLLRTYELRSIFEATDSGPPKNFQEFRLSDLPGFYRAYIWFALLHELGHWKFHRGERRLFDSTQLADFRANDREELEADRFALQSMVVAYGTDVAAGGHRVVTVQEDISSALSLEPGATMGSRVCGDVGAMFSLLTYVTMMTPAPFAPFYHDQTHPNLISRAIGIVRQCLAQPDLSPIVGRSLSSVLSLDQRTSTLMRQPLVELISPFQIEDVAFENHSLLLSAFGRNALIHVPMKEIEQRIQTTEPTSMRVNGISAAAGQPLNRGSKFVWSSAVSGVMRFQGGQLYSAGTSSWVPLPGTISSFAHHIYRLLDPPQPSEFSFLLLAGDDGRLSYFHTISGASVIASRTSQDILDEAVSRGIPANRLEPSTTMSDGLFVTLEKYTDKDHVLLLGTTFLDGRTLKSLRWSGKPKMTGNGYVDYGSHLIAGPDADFRGYTLVQTLQPGSSTAWTIWRLSEDTNPFQVKIGPPLRRGGILSNESIGSVPTLANFSFLPPKSVLLNFAQDSVYSLRPDDGRMEFVFPFGDDVLLRQRISNTGVVAIFVENGYKVYLLPSNLVSGF
jgi:hypothetical protein